MSLLRRVPPALLLIVMLAATSSFADTVPVTISSFQFSPNPVVVKEGDTILWTNAGGFHTVTSGLPCVADGLFNSGTLSGGGMFPEVFPTAGTIPYFCIPHCGIGMTGTIIVEPDPTGIGDLPERDVALGQNYPNPFNPTTTIEYVVKRSARVEIAVYNVSGRFVQRLESAARAPGAYSVEWDGANAKGVAQASGVYYYRLTVDGARIEMRKMILLK